MPPLDLSRLRRGLKGEATCVADQSHSARSLGSGTLDVFATPMMIALMEAAAMRCIDGMLPEGQTSLGTQIDVTHVAASPLGLPIRASAELIEIADRTLTFRLEAHDGVETIGRGVHRRVVVDTGRFLDKVRRKSTVAP
jgi:predicted thioesterase